MQYPSLVRPITLSHRSVLGRDVNGIEISTGAQNTADGKPIFLIMGEHHAREWPSAEHTIEFAYDLLRNYGRNARTTQLVQSTRTIVIPVVNPDGFNISREAATLGDFSLFDYEMKRKNCRVSDNTPNKYAKGACDDNKAGRLPRHRPEPQLRRPVGRRRREHDLVGRHLPRRRAVLRARGAERPRADLVAAGDQPDHEPHVLEPGAARAGSGELRLPAGGADLQGAGRVAGRPQRLLEHPGLRALRHHGRDGGLVVLVDRRAGVHVRDRRGRLPSGLPRRGWRRSTSARRPRPVPARAATARRTTRCCRRRRQLAPLADRGRRARRIDAEDLEDVPDLDLAGLAGRPRQLDRRPADCSPTR